MTLALFLTSRETLRNQTKGAGRREPPFIHSFNLKKQRPPAALFSFLLISRLMPNCLYCYTCFNILQYYLPFYGSFIYLFLKLYFYRRMILPFQGWVMVRMIKVNPVSLFKGNHFTERNKLVSCFRYKKKKRRCFICLFFSLSSSNG